MCSVTSAILAEAVPQKRILGTVSRMPDNSSSSQVAIPISANRTKRSIYYLYSATALSIVMSLNN